MPISAVRADNAGNSAPSQNSCMGMNALPHKIVRQIVDRRTTCSDMNENFTRCDQCDSNLDMYVGMLCLIRTSRLR